mgnify:CR=1 FL=1
MIADEKCIDNSLLLMMTARLISSSTVSRRAQHLGGRIGERPHDYQEGDHAPLHPRLSGMGGGMARVNEGPFVIKRNGSTI